MVMCSLTCKSGYDRVSTYLSAARQPSQEQHSTHRYGEVEFTFIQGRELVHQTCYNTLHPSKLKLN